LMFTLYTSEK